MLEIIDFERLCTQIPKSVHTRKYRRSKMLKISRIARHNVVQMGPCHRCTLNACGPNFRDY